MGVISFEQVGKLSCEQATIHMRMTHRNSIHLYSQMIPQPDVRFQQLFQTGITLLHHRYLLLSKSGHIYIHMYQQRMNSLQSNNIKKEVIMKTAIC